VLPNEKAKMAVKATPAAGIIARLRPVILMEAPIQIPYDSNVLLELDVCLSADQGRDFGITTVVQGTDDKSTSTHFICKGLPCAYDSKTIIGRDPSPFPVGMASAPLSSFPDKVYVLIHCRGGMFNDSTKSYIGNFTFGASISGS